MTDSQPIARETLDRQVLEMLVCPLTKTQLSFDKDKMELISRGARLAYPIKKGVPLLCLSEARTLDNHELDKLR